MRLIKKRVASPFFEEKGSVPFLRDAEHAEASGDSAGAEVVCGDWVTGGIRERPRSLL